MSTWRDAYVAIEGVTPVYAAQVRTDARWNGWAIPRFRRPEAETIALDVTSPVYGEPDARAEWDGDTLTIQLVGNEVAEVYRPDTDGMYSVGARAWCWLEAEDEDDTEAAAG